MLNELSCWYFDWATVGTWVGGLATAGAALWGVYVAVTAWNGEKLRRRIKNKTQAILIAPELAHSAIAADSLIQYTEQILNTPIKLAYLRSRLSLDAAKEMARSNGEMDEGLAIALGEFVVTVSMLQDSLDRWGIGPMQGKDAENAILSVTKLVRPKAEKLAEQLAQSALGSKELLDAALKRQGGGVGQSLEASPL